MPESTEFALPEFGFLPAPQHGLLLCPQHPPRGTPYRAALHNTDLHIKHYKIRNLCRVSLCCSALCQRYLIFSACYEKEPSRPAGPATRHGCDAPHSACAPQHARIVITLDSQYWHDLSVKVSTMLTLLYVLVSQRIFADNRRFEGLEAGWASRRRAAEDARGGRGVGGWSGKNTGGPLKTCFIAIYISSRFRMVRTLL